MFRIRGGGGVFRIRGVGWGTHIPLGREGGGGCPGVGQGAVALEMIHKH